MTVYQVRNSVLIQKEIKSIFHIEDGWYEYASDAWQEWKEVQQLMENSITNLEQLVLQWADIRGLLVPDNIRNQYIKLTEEVG